MTRTARSAAIAAGLALSTLPLLGPVAAAAETTMQTKAQIEHDERAAISTSPNKAQIEHEERAQVSTGSGQSSVQGGSESSSTTGSSGSGDAAAWQLAVSALFGAALTGGAVLVSRQVSGHRQAVAQ